MNYLVYVYYLNASLLFSFFLAFFLKKALNKDIYISSAGSPEEIRRMDFRGLS